MSMDFMQILKELTETLCHAGMLFDSYAFNELIKKYSEEELKNFITVYYIVGKNYTNGEYTETSKVYEITDSIFNKIEVFYSPYVPDDYIKTGFRDSRKDSSKYDYKPFFSEVREK